MDDLSKIALSAKALKNLQRFAWPNGAKVYCGICFKTKIKTAEQMKRLMEKWPVCCDRPIEVRPL